MVETIHYRHPTTRTPRNDPLTGVRRLELHYRLECASLIGAGIVLSLIGPAVLATLCWLGAPQFYLDVIPHYWLHLFFKCWLVLFPLSLIIALITHRNLTDEISGDWSASVTSAMLVGRAAILTGFIDLCCLAPRMMIDGGKRLWSLRAHARANRIIAARIAAALLTYPEGVSPATLFTASQTDQTSFSDALALLAYLEAIDIAKAGDRVWLQTTAREQLARL